MCILDSAIWVYILNTFVWCFRKGSKYIGVKHCQKYTGFPVILFGKSIIVLASSIRSMTFFFCVDFLVVSFLCIFLLFVFDYHVVLVFHSFFRITKNIVTLWLRGLFFSLCYTVRKYGSTSFGIQSFYIVAVWHNVKKANLKSIVLRIKFELCGKLSK